MNINKYIVKFVFHVALHVMLSQATPWLQVMLCFYLTICQYRLTLRVSKVCVCTCVHMCVRVSVCFCTLVSVSMPESALMSPSPLIWAREPDQFAFWVAVKNACTRGCLSILHTCHLVPDRMGWCEFHGAAHWVRMRLDHESCYPPSTFLTPSYKPPHFNQIDTLASLMPEETGKEGNMGTRYLTQAWSLPNTPKCTVSHLKDLHLNDCFRDYPELRRLNHSVIQSCSYSMVCETFLSGLKWIKMSSW